MPDYSFEEVPNILLISLFNLWDVVLTNLPQIISAFLVLILGFILSPIFGMVAKRLVKLIQIDSLAEKFGVTKLFKDLGMHFTFAGLVGRLVNWFFIIAFIIAAADILGWSRVTEFLFEIVFYLPNVIIAVIILAFGLIIGNFVEKAVKKGIGASNLPIGKSDALASVAKWSVVIFSLLAALLQLGIASRLIEIFFGGLVLALALAFGLGGKERAAKALDKLSGGK